MIPKDKIKVMKVTELEIKKLKKAVYDENLSQVKDFVKKHGTLFLFQEFFKEGGQPLYPHMYRDYLIHVAIDNDDYAMLQYFNEIGLTPTINYTIDTNFNSRADQFFDHEIIDLITYARNNRCSEATVNFIKN